MSDVLVILLWSLAVLAILLLHTAFWRRYFHLDRTGDEIHFATTEDGWRIAVHRYRPGQPTFEEPVVLCHGMGANRFNYDMSEDRSFARDLASRGFEVFSIELRATGMSSRPRWFSPYHWKFDFDTYLGQDIPAALSEVQRVTGAEGVYWVGHSMGGMLGYAWLGLRGRHGLKGLVTIGSPVHLHRSRTFWGLKPLVWLMAVGRVVPWRPLARFFSPLLGSPTAWLARLTTVRGGMEGPLLRRCLANLVENTTGAVLRQFLGWARRNTFSSSDGEESYLDNLTSIREPVLILSSDADRIAPTDAVTPAYQLVGSEDKQLRVFGTDRGDDHDLGHGDILLGVHARELVYPEIINWLEARATSVRAESEPATEKE